MRNLLFWATLAIYVGGTLPAQSIKYIGRYTNEQMLGELAEQDMYRPVGLIVSVIRMEGQLHETGEMGYYDSITTGTATLVRKRSEELTSSHILTSRHVLELGPHSFQKNPLISKFSSCAMRIISQSFYIDGTWYSIDAHSKEHPIVCVARLGGHVPNILPARIGHIKNSELLKRLTGGTNDGSDLASSLYLTETLKNTLSHSLTLCGFGLSEKIELPVTPLSCLFRQETEVIYPPLNPSSAYSPAPCALTAPSSSSPTGVNLLEQGKETAGAQNSINADATAHLSPFGFRKVDGAALLAAEEQLTQGPFLDVRSRGLINHKKRACMLFPLDPQMMPQDTHDHWVISILSDIAFALPSKFREDFFKAQCGRRASGTWSLYGITTPGDSGAPLFYQNAGSDEGPFVVGVHEMEYCFDPRPGHHAPHHKQFKYSFTFNGENLEQSGIWPKDF